MSELSSAAVTQKLLWCPLISDDEAMHTPFGMDLLLFEVLEAASDRRHPQAWINRQALLCSSISKFSQSRLAGPTGSAQSPRLY